MNISLWIAQGLLALSFVFGGLFKLMQSPEELAAIWPWTASNLTLLKFTGFIDLIAGFGLLLPALLRIQPKLTVFAAIGSVLLMISAIVFHVSRREGSDIIPNIIFGFIAMFIAWGRSKKYPILPKSST